jgi:hypothetical protein
MSITDLSSAPSLHPHSGTTLVGLLAGSKACSESVPTHHLGLLHTHPIIIQAVELNQR